MKLILDDGREIILSEEAQEILKKEISVKNFSKEGDTRYWYINSYGKILDSGTVLSKDTISFSAFTNKEFAEKIAFKQLMERKLLKFKEEYDNVDLDWGNKNSGKIALRWNAFENKIEAIKFCATKIQGAIYFSSFEIAEKCIEMYKDDLIKYFEMDIW